MKPLENGWNPFKRETVFIPGHFFYSFSNEYGEVWVAYISLWSHQVYVSGVDVDWTWRDIKNVDWVLNLDEQEWISSVNRMARRLREQGIDSNEKNKS